ncbi:MAG: acyl-CoA dehydrogenase [Ilumatobacteraceae bacterium]
MPYRPPLEEMQFVLEHVAGAGEISSWPGLEHADLGTMAGLLEEAGRFVAEVIAPLQRVGDEQPATRHDDGSVTTPPGTPEAYAKFVDSGWGGISFPEAIGGGGFPWITTIAIQEMLSTANMGFSLCPLLTQGAIELLWHHGSPEQQVTYLPKMVSGEWTGTMNLTEPDAGSDVGALRTKAVKQDDGTYKISGTKIFITYGEHDLADNIVHLVLARTPEAPAGTKGISVFIVPKFVLDANGNPGERNRVECLKIEHKAGIHASPTAVLEFDEATGFLIGEEQTGMRSMFTMMNNARLSVGLQGLSVAEGARQLALQYAHDRIQSRAVGSSEPGPSPIIEHPDVKLMLATMTAGVEAMRSLLYFDAVQVDRAASHPDEAERRAANDLSALLTPICKAWSTDLGVELSSLGIQVHGGMGYIEETGAAQYWRDSRIAPIYEGTNGIQAIDLLLRKLPLGGGAVVDDLFAQVEKEAGDTPALAATRNALGYLRAATTEGRVLDALAGATPFLRMFGNVLGDWLLQRGANAARSLLDAGTGDAEFLKRRVAVADFFRTRILPTTVGLEPVVGVGHDGLAEVF